MKYDVKKALKISIKKSGFREFSAQADTKKLTEQILEVERGARKRTVSARTVLSACEDAERKLGEFLNKLQSVGARLVVECKEEMPRAYKYDVCFTKVVLERLERNRWAVIEIVRDYDAPVNEHRTHLEFTEEQERIIKDKQFEKWASRL